MQKYKIFIDSEIEAPDLEKALLKLGAHLINCGVDHNYSNDNILKGEAYISNIKNNTLFKLT